MPKILNPTPAAAAALVPLTLGLLLAATQPSNAQSFNCRSAHYTDEAAICQDPTLGRLDNRLNSVYNGVYRRLPPEAQRRLDRDEDSWVARRRQCGADPACITQAYQQRMRQLDSEIGSLQQTPLHNPPPGFPAPPPPFRPFGGAPVATAPDFAPRPPFAPPRQTTETIEERGTQPPPPSVERRQSSETVQQRAAPAAQNEQRQSDDTVERRDDRAAPADRGSEGNTEAPSRTITVTTESGSAPEQAGAEQAQQPTRHKASKRSKTSRSSKPAHEKASDGPADQTASAKPAQESAAPSTTHRETNVTAIPAPQPAEPHSGSSQEPKHAAPAKAAPPAPRDQKREVAAAPAQQHQQSSGSSEAPSKPAIRWVDPPPSK